jgi:hypothetical protein
MLPTSNEPHATATHASNLSEEAIRAQVTRLASSTTFAAAETQKRMLLYLAEKSLSADTSWLKEYTIGVEALGKPTTYDPQRDSIVRIQASRLRTKLASYYREEGQHDPILVDLPKGQFKLTFSARAADEETRDQPPTGRPAQKWRTVALALGVALIVAAGWAAWATRAALQREDPAGSQQAWSEDMVALWSPLLQGTRLQNRRPLLVSTGAAMFLRVQEIGFVRVPGVNSAAEIPQSPVLGRLTDNFKKSAVPWTNFTLVGESAAAFNIGKILGMRRRDVIFTNTTSLSWEEIAQHDMVFIGPPKFIPHVKELQPLDLALELEGVRNLRPQPGEPDYFRDRGSPGNPSDGEAHALISRLTGIRQDSEVLSVGGNWGPDTVAASQYLTEPHLAAALVKRIRKPDGTLPKHYQVVIRVEFRNMTPLRTSIVAHRAYSP